LRQRARVVGEPPEEESVDGGPEALIVPGPALPPYSRRDGPAYESSLTCTYAQTASTYSAGAGALVPIAYTGS
jgi:hypothetical protein